jgi:hypothetical protein
MKFLFMTVAMLFTLSAFAVENLYDLKRSANESISREMSKLEQIKSCISGAQTTDAFKNCHYDVGTLNMQKEEAIGVDKRLNQKADEALKPKVKMLENQKTIE